MSKFVNEGENRVVDILFGSQAVDDTLYLGIYTNETEPAEDATLASITEPVGNGYARIVLARGTWVITADYAQYAQQTFTADGGNWGNCYGYFIATSSDGTGKLLAVEQFSSGPFNTSDGDSIKITPKITVS